ncbi:MAG: LLM class flavin-dependent oxidoreductase [Bdellovibrionales bacterium]|nr:LLM class flavin-dependent oxidoreductase [Bdellovibrionales bacterium]
MNFDIFLSICQTEVDGYLPSEKIMFQNFFDQVELADQLGFDTAWVAETHLSCQVQKENPEAVIPHFKGEIGLNTDILQLAQQVFHRTKNINIGSAIKNILCNGGPLAHAEAIKTFLSLHGMNPQEKRFLNIGFASGRFEFSNRPYGIAPRNQTERVAWKVIKGKILFEATEIFLRALRGDHFSSSDIAPKFISEKDFRTIEEWEITVKTYAKETSLTADEAANLKKIEIPPFWNFDKVGVIPFEAPLELLKLTVGSHDPGIQELANQYFPVDVFNLSITPPEVIEQTHERMKKIYHKEGGVWQRENMPRTAMIFLSDEPGLSAEENNLKAQAMAKNAWENYWTAMEGTIDDKKVEQAVENTLAGNPDKLAQLLNEKYHPQDRLMLWFDFNTHDNEYIKSAMKIFVEKVAPQCKK